ncbi:MAG: diacylglycerol kinase family lipid kinase [Bacillota bacterium]|nr:diacylglycerol kinase family lipid kinase [Bacillota bacterium]
MKKIAVIANPNAGRKMAKQRVEELAEILSQEGAELRIHYTQKNEKTSFTVKELSADADILIVMGGDGTVNEVVNGLMELSAAPPLAIFPMGTVNDYATYLEIPKNIHDFSEMLLISHKMAVDVGIAGQRHFLNVAAGGLLPELAHRVSSEAKTVLGKFAYYMEGIREFPKQFFHPIPIQLEVEGKIFDKKILFFLAANSPYVGGFRNLVPKARVDDGLLELLVVESGELQDMANVLLNFLRRQLDPDQDTVKGISYYRVREFHMNSAEVVDVDVDGELGGHLPLTFSVIPRALQVIVPKPLNEKQEP